MVITKVNEDLQGERKKCDFNVEELTNLLDGGASYTNQRRNMGEFENNEIMIIHYFTETLMTKKTMVWINRYNLELIMVQRHMYDICQFRLGTLGLLLQNKDFLKDNGGQRLLPIIPKNNKLR